MCTGLIDRLASMYLYTLEELGRLQQASFSHSRNHQRLVRAQVWVNLGIMYLAIGQSAEAARMFSTALSKFYNNKEKTVLLYLARALYDQGKNHEAKRTLLKALHLVPNDHQLLFNVALCMQNYAVAVRSPPPLIIILYHYLNLLTVSSSCQLLFSVALCMHKYAVAVRSLPCS